MRHARSITSSSDAASSFLSASAIRVFSASIIARYDRANSAPSPRTPAPLCAAGPLPQRARTSCFRTRSSLRSGSSETPRGEPSSRWSPRHVRNSCGRLRRRKELNSQTRRGTTSRSDLACVGLGVQYHEPRPRRRGQLMGACSSAPRPLEVEAVDVETVEASRSASWAQRRQPSRRDAAGERYKWLARTAEEADIKVSDRLKLLRGASQSSSVLRALDEGELVLLATMAKVQVLAFKLGENVMTMSAARHLLRNRIVRRACGQRHQRRAHGAGPGVIRVSGPRRAHSCSTTAAWAPCVARWRSSPVGRGATRR